MKAKKACAVQQQACAEAGKDAGHVSSTPEVLGGFSGARKQPVKGNHNIELHHEFIQNEETASFGGRRSSSMRDSPSPVPVVRSKTSPRSSPRTLSPASMLHKQLPVAHNCRTPSPRASPVPLTSKAKAAAHRPSSGASYATCDSQENSRSLSIRSASSAFKKPGKQSPVQMTNRVNLKAQLVNVGASMAANELQRRASKSPIMEMSKWPGRIQSKSHTMKRARSNSPKPSLVQAATPQIGSRRLSVSVGKSFAKAASRMGQSLAESTMERSSTVSPISAGQHSNQSHNSTLTQNDQRLDPTSRDLEFLLGNSSSGNQLDDNNSLCSDHELDIVMVDGMRKRSASSLSLNQGETAHGRPATTTALPTQSIGNAKPKQRPSSCTGVSSYRQNQRLHSNGSLNGNFIGKLVAKRQEPGTETRQQRSQYERPSSPMLISANARRRSCSWDSPEEAKPGKAKLDLQSEIALEEKSKVVQPEAWRSHDEDMEVSLDKLAGMSLEDVFQLERVLHQYKEELLRQRIYSSTNPGLIHVTGHAQTQQQPMFNQENCKNNSNLGNSNLEESSVTNPESVIHPPERCNSGNCFLDESDEPILGKMDFEDYEPTYQFQEQTNSGARAPNFKMFRSNGRSSQSSEEDAQGSTKAKDRYSNLSKSPGNISFVTRVAKQVEQNVLKLSSPNHNHPSVHKVLRECCGPSKTALDAARDFHLSSSPMSAFSKATVKSKTTGDSAQSNSKPIKRR